jgi:sugar transferase (PEP-CTERM system associated)
MIRVLNVYYPTRTIVLLLCEALIVCGCFLLATVIVLGSDTFIVLNYEYGAAKLTFLTILVLLCSYYFDLYEPQLLQDRREVYFRVLFVVGFVCLSLSLLVFFIPAVGMAQYVLPLGFAFLAGALLAWRRIYEWILTKKFFRECVYVLGGGNYAGTVAELINSRAELGMDVCDWDGISTDKDERKRNMTAVLTRLNTTRPNIDRIIVAMEDRRGELPVQELLALRFRGVMIEEAGTFLERLSGKIQLDGLRPSSFLFAEGFRIKPSQQLTRRIASFLVSAIGLLLFLPVAPFVILAIKLSSDGPLFFQQTRVGVGGRNFTVYKFRSMVQNAEAAGAAWASQNDPRVTAVGRFLRKTRIDEIPQLWNVLRGDMSLVGPRPERPEFVPWLEEQLPFYGLRHMIRPGLTGWAQVRFKYGATLEDSREKLEYDLYYVKHMTLGLDLLIMFETIKTIVRRRGAQ